MLETKPEVHFLPEEGDTQPHEQNKQSKRNTNPGVPIQRWRIVCAGRSEHQFPWQSKLSSNPASDTEHSETEHSKTEQVRAATSRSQSLGDVAVSIHKVNVDVDEEALASEREDLRRKRYILIGDVIEKGGIDNTPNNERCDARDKQNETHKDLEGDGGSLVDQVSEESSSDGKGTRLSDFEASKSHLPEDVAT